MDVGTRADGGLRGGRRDPTKPSPAPTPRIQSAGEPLPRRLHGRRPVLWRHPSNRPGIGARLVRHDDIELVPIGSRPNIEALAELAGRPAERSVVVPTEHGALEVLWIRYALYRQLAKADVHLLHCIKQMVPRRLRVPVVLTVHDFMLLDRPQDFDAAKAKLLPPLYRRALTGAERWIAGPRRAWVESSSGGSRCRRTRSPRSPSGRRAGRGRARAGGRRRRLVRPRGRRSVPPQERGVPRPPLVRRPRRHRPAADRCRAARAGSPRRRRPRSRRSSGPASGAGSAGCPTPSSAGSTSGRRSWVRPVLAEGYGLAVVEAASFGCPVVTSDVPSLQEMAGAQALTTLPLNAPDRWVQAVVAGGARPERAAPLAARTWQDAADQGARWRCTARPSPAVSRPRVVEP